MASWAYGQTLAYWKDVMVSHVNVFIGRLLPLLKPEQVDLSGKIAIVTGANSGIGLQMATNFVQQGAAVYLACRNTSKAQQAIEGIVKQHPDTKGRLHVLQLDTSRLGSVRSFAASWAALKDNKIDVLCHNAGAGQSLSPDQFYSVDGIEILYATNFLGSFLLTHLLEPHLSSTARVVFTSSIAALLSKFSPDFALKGLNGPVKDKIETGFHCPPPIHFFGKVIVPDGENSRYNNCKAMQAAFATSLQQHFDRKAILEGRTLGGGRPTAHAFSPGLTMTPIFDKFRDDTTWAQDPVYSAIRSILVCAVSVDQGAATGTWLATTSDPDVVGPGKGGGFWERMTRRMAVGDMVGQAVLDRLWARWECDAGIEWRA